MKSPWPTKKLGEIAEIYSGGRHGITKSDYVETGFPAYSAAGQDGFTEEAYDNGFAVVLSSIGSRCGKCFYAEGRWTALANTQVIKLNNPITAKFLYYYLNDEKKWPKSGTGQPFISPRTVKNFLVPLPPLSVQKKIVYVLDSIEEAVRVQDKIVEKTKELKRAMMHKLFREGTRGAKLKKTETPKESKLPTGQVGEIPENWEVVRLGDIVEETDQIDLKKYLYKKIKYIDVSSISNQDFRIIEFKEFLGKDAPGRAKKVVRFEDIIFATVRPYLKRVAIVPAEFDSEVCSTAFCVLRCKKNIADPYFVFNYLITDKFINRISELQTGSNYPAVSDKDVLEQLIPLPPLPEQQEIAEILQTIDEKIEIEKKKKALYEELFKTMLNKLMKGRLE